MWQVQNTVFVQKWLAVQVKSQYEGAAVNVLTVGPVRWKVDQDINVIYTNCEINGGKTANSLQMQWVHRSQECVTNLIFLSCNTYREDSTIA
jgi:hypothetical protein